MEEEIANILEKIAVVEMRHHERLGNLIVKLGGDPYFVNSRNIPFQIRCVKRTKNLKKQSNIPQFLTYKRQSEQIPSL